MAMSNLKGSITELISDLLKDQTAKAFKQLREDLIKEFTENLDREQDEIIAKTAVKLSKYYSVNTLEDRVIIEVKRFDFATPNKKGNV